MSAQAQPLPVIGPQVVSFASSVLMHGLHGAPGLAIATTAGTVAAGAKSITIANTGTVVATVKAVSLAVGQKVSWQNCNGLGAVAYDPGAGGSITIVTVR